MVDKKVACTRPCKPYRSRKRPPDACMVGRIYRSAVKTSGEPAVVCEVLASGEFGKDYSRLIAKIGELLEQASEPDVQSAIEGLKLGVGGYTLAELVQLLRDVIKEVERLGRRYRFLRYVVRRLLLLSSVLKLVEFMAGFLDLWEVIEELAIEYRDVGAKWQCPLTRQCKVKK